MKRTVLTALILTVAGGISAHAGDDDWHDYNRRHEIERERARACEELRESWRPQDHYEPHYAPRYREHYEYRDQDPHHEYPRYRHYQPRHSSHAWIRIAELNAGPGAREIGVGRAISQVRIVCLDSAVIINTVAVRAGSGVHKHTVGRRLYAGQEQILHVGSGVYSTGLRISDDNRGRYAVYVR